MEFIESLAAFCGVKFILNRAIRKIADDDSGRLGRYTLDVFFALKFFTDRKRLTCECGHGCDSDDDGQISHFELLVELNIPTMHHRVPPDPWRLGHGGPDDLSGQKKVLNRAPIS